MPRWLVANSYIISCEHEVEAADEEEAINLCRDIEDNLDTFAAEYCDTHVVQSPEEEGE